MTATGKDSTGKDVAIATEIQGVVDSVDLTATPPLLSIGGQNYTTDQIRRVIRPTAPPPIPLHARRVFAPRLSTTIAIPARPGVSPDAGPKGFGGHFQGDSY